jgi:hypothetical protein
MENRNITFESPETYRSISDLNVFFSSSLHTFEYIEDISLKISKADLQS